MTRAAKGGSWREVVAIVLGALGLLSAGAYAVLELFLLAVGEPKPSATGKVLFFSPSLAAAGLAIAAIFLSRRVQARPALWLGVASVAVVPSYLFFLLPHL